MKTGNGPSRFLHTREGLLYVFEKVKLTTSPKFFSDFLNKKTRTGFAMGKTYFFHVLKNPKKKQHFS